MAEGFIFYPSFYDALLDLDDETRLQCYDMICEYAFTGHVDTSKGLAYTIFKLIRPQLDANARRKENGKKGGRPKKTQVEYGENQRIENKKTTGFENEKPKEKEKEKKEEKKKSPTETKKKTEPVRHQRGEYGHVLLSDDEYQKLITDFGEQMAKDAIQVVDNYCESHGVTYKRYNAVIRDWGIKRVKEDAEKKQKRASPQYHNRYNDFPQRNNDYKQIEEEWIRRAFGA